MNVLKNKVALISGASSGIGRAAALLLAHAGAAVVLIARRHAELNEVVTQIETTGGRAIGVTGDVANEAVAKNAVDVAVGTFGGLDISFNNAGTLGELGPTTDISVQGWRQTLDVNLTSAFLAAKYQVPAMLNRGAGSIIFTSTFVGHTVGIPQAAAYAASKAGLIGLMQVLAAEYGPRSIRVNALLPGGTDTPMAREMNSTPEAMAQVANLHALKRIATPQELAQAVLFLASDASSFMTGSAMLVDGGISINRS